MTEKKDMKEPKGSIMTKSTKSNVGYNRVAIKRGPQSDPKPILSYISYRDKFMCFVTGESEETRVARSRLSAYLKMLESEYQCVGVARSQHYEGGKKLCSDFEVQKLQLQKWGLLTVLQVFQMQVMF